MKIQTKKLTTTAIFAAIICVVTAFVAVPAPAIGNINLGDIFILCAAWLLGPWGAVAAGIGSCLADLLSGFAVYAPATLVIKAIMALACYYFFSFLKKFVKHLIFSRLLSALVAEAIMVMGYFIYESILYDISTALASIPFNLIQGSACLFIGTFCSILLYKSQAIRNFSKEFTVI
ncbi:MAG: ECF transporter S component [Clostridia bacterium]|nr:ECF transporter S component [Clostridia bacterium]